MLVIHNRRESNTQTHLTLTQINGFWQTLTVVRCGFVIDSAWHQLWLWIHCILNMDILMQQLIIDTGVTILTSIYDHYIFQNIIIIGVPLSRRFRSLKLWYDSCKYLRGINNCLFLKVCTKNIWYFGAPKIHPTSHPFSKTFWTAHIER